MMMMMMMWESKDFRFFELLTMREEARSLSEETLGFDHSEYNIICWCVDDYDDHNNKCVCVVVDDDCIAVWLVVVVVLFDFLSL